MSVASLIFCPNWRRITNKSMVDDISMIHTSVHICWMKELKKGQLRIVMFGGINRETLNQILTAECRLISKTSNVSELQDPWSTFQPLA
jgi:hypothetical protein